MKLNDSIADKQVQARILGAKLQRACSIVYDRYVLELLGKRMPYMSCNKLRSNVKKHLSLFMFIAYRRQQEEPGRLRTQISRMLNTDRHAQHLQAVPRVSTEFLLPIRQQLSDPIHPSFPSV